MDLSSDLPLLGEAMRWFGPADPVSLDEIRQTGAAGVFSALHEIPYGEEWPRGQIEHRRALITAAGLRWAAVESVPVHESIKTRTGDFRRHIAHYQSSLRNLGAAGIKVVVYNFMPVLDWVRTDLHYRLPDGAETLRYDPVMFAAFDLFALRRPGADRDFTPAQCAEARALWDAWGAEDQNKFVRQTLDLFPGVKLNLQLDDLARMLERYSAIDSKRLKEHLKLFLEEITPAAEDAGIKLAIHPDDPPFSVLGLPRIVSTENDIADILEMVASPANGFCLCTGSLGVRPENNLLHIAQRFGPRIYAAHLRSIERETGGGFYEAPHLGGATPMYGVVRELIKEGARRRSRGQSDWQIVFRPDHGHKILSDFNRPEPICPGYPLLGRMKGLAELRGMQVAIAQALAEQTQGVSHK